MAESRVPVSELSGTRKRRVRREDVCLKTYSMETVKAVCYRYSSRFFSRLSLRDDTAAIVEFQIPSTLSEAEEAALLEEFRHDLLDQSLRESVRESTEVTRNLILANAFANSSLSEGETDSAKESDDRGTG